MSRRASWLAIVGVLVAGSLWAWLAREERVVVGAERGEAEVVRVVGGGVEAVTVPGSGLATVSGMVRGPQGRPVVGATVCALLDWSLPGASAAARCVASERDGHYRIAGLLPLRIRVSATAPGYVARFHGRGEGASRKELVWLRGGEEAREVDVVLAGGGVEIVGVVRDLSGGAVEGAQVVSGGPAVGAGLAITTTGSEGEFSLWVAPGTARVWTRMEGYAFGEDSGVAPGHRFELLLTPESVLVGKVVRASDGTPVAGASVTAGFGENEESDAAGNFRIAGLLPRGYKLRAETDDAFGLAREEVLLGLGETSAPVVIEVHPALSVAGTVVIEGGDGCDRGGTIGMVSLKGEPGGAAAIEPDGSAKLRALKPGEYTMHVHCNGMLSAASYPNVVLNERSLSGLRWTVTRGQTIRGVVVDQGGRPVSGVSVLALPVVDPSRPDARVGAMRADTSASGEFVAAGMVAGKYELMVTNEREGGVLTETPLAVELTTGDLEGVRLVLPAGGELRGRVRDAGGRGLARVTVVLAGARERAVLAADDGSFGFTSVLVGEYRVRATRGGEVMRTPGSGDDDVQGTRVVVKAGAVESVELVVEEADGEITGVVRDADGGVVSDAFVEASREPESAAAVPGEAARARWRSSTERPVLTDADGRFTLVGLLPGKYSVRAQRRGGGEGLYEHAALGEDVAVGLVETGSVAGTVVLAGGEVPAEFTISLSDRASGYWRHDKFYRTGGAWSLMAVERGDFEITARTTESKGTVKLALAAGEVKTGVRVELGGLVTARGTVVDLEGTPVAGVEVVIPVGGSYSLGMPGEQVSDAAGRFTVRRAPVGVVQVIAVPRDRDAFQTLRTTMTIAEGQDEVELGTIRVVRTLVKDGEVVGDLGYTLRRSEPTAAAEAVRQIVAVVRPGGPAAQAGLLVGDEIVTVAGESVIGADAYLHYNLTRVAPGATVQLGLARGVTIAVKAGKLP